MNLRWFGVVVLACYYSSRSLDIVLIVEARISLSSSGGGGGHRPEASSTLLRLHQQYLRQPPHDTTLYDVLRVSPNATASEITKSYRKLCRQYHPDKQSDLNTSDRTHQKQLEQVQQAYDVLRSDRTRLSYHRHGLVDVHDAVLVLTGKGSSNTDTKLLHELLRLMGYDHGEHGRVDPSGFEERQRRVWLVASDLIEKMRPVIEGSLPDDSYLMDDIIRQCDLLKRLPLGAQIIRCIGRAYRYRGQRVLRRYNRHQRHQLHQFYNHNHRTLPKLLDWQDSVHDKFRHVKHIATAALASGRAVLKEQAVSKKSQNSTSLPTITHTMWDTPSTCIIPGDEHVLASCDVEPDLPPTDADIREMEQMKADIAFLESLQVEALWKICKIDLDRVIQEACDMILDGSYFYFPSHATLLGDANSYVQRNDGWVGSSGTAIDADYARSRTATLLVRIGEIMVRQSKVGTSWMD